MYQIYPRDFGRIRKRDIAATTNTLACIDSNGRCWTWGANINGELGQNTSATSTSIASIVVGNHTFVKVGGASSTAGTFIALKADGSAWGWGTNNLGQLGDNSATNRSSPVSVVGGHSFIDVTGSVRVFVALKANGTAWGFGQNTGGWIGDGTATNKSSPSSVVGNHSFIQISSNNVAFYGLKTDGTLWAWGSDLTNLGGDLATNQTAISNRSSPTSVVGNHSFIQVGGNHALKADGSCWGWGGSSDIGDNAAVGRSSPVSVVGGHSFIYIQNRTFWTAGFKADGSVWCWGTNANGELGIGTAAGTSKSSPTSVLGGLYSGPKKIMGGVGGTANLTALLLTDNGTLWAWGTGTSGQHGKGDLVSRSSPVSVGRTFF